MAEEPREEEPVAEERRAKAKDDEFPWRWAAPTSSSAPVVISPDRLSVLFHPRRSTGCAAVAGEKPLHKHMEHFFEVVMAGPLHGQARMVGVGNKFAPLQSGSKDFFPLIGKDGNSWGLNYDGELIHDANRRSYCDMRQSTFNKEGIRVGVYYDSYYGNLSFSVDNKCLGIAYNNIPIVIDLYPMVCSSSRNSNMTLVSCYSSVVSLKALCRGTVRMYTKEEDIDKLPIPPHLILYNKFRAF